MTEAELLFTDVLGCSRVELYLNKDKKIDKNKTFFISSALKRRIKGEPIQYILGKTEFMGLEFKVTPDVLIPRQETEILVEIVIKEVQECRSAGVQECERLTLRLRSGLMVSEAEPLKILDLGTGSGCIAVSLAKLLDNAEITAVDISSKSIKIARYNAKLNDVNRKIKFIIANLFSGLRVGECVCYDIIVSNPPYVPSGEIDILQTEIKYEPRIALNAGMDGLFFYRKIIAGAAGYLKKGGLLIMEMGFGQKEKIENIFRESGKYEIIKLIKDYGGIDRVIVAQKLPNEVRVNG